MIGYLKKIKLKEVTNSQETLAKQRKMEAPTYYLTGSPQILKYM